MYKVKNLVETTFGKYLLVACIGFIAFVVFLIGYVALSSIKEEVQGTSNEQENIEGGDGYITNEVLYSGTWYSNRSDKAILNLNEDGTYSSNAWVLEGKFSIEEGVLVLEDILRGTFFLELHTVGGETVLYDSEEGYYFYSSQEQLEEAVKVQQGFDELEANIEQQKWLDVLKQGTWKYSVDDVGYSMVFADKQFTIENLNKETTDSATFEYYIEDIYISEEGATITLQRKREDVDANYLPATFQIEETSTKYILSAQAGTFLWNNVYEKSIADVELTQNGITEEEKSQLQSIFVDEDGNRVVVKEKELE